LEFITKKVAKSVSHCSATEQQQQHNATKKAAQFRAKMRVPGGTPEVQ
jgi:hypothetical protein